MTSLALKAHAWGKDEEEEKDVVVESFPEIEHPQWLTVDANVEPERLDSERLDALGVNCKSLLWFLVGTRVRSYPSSS